MKLLKKILLGSMLLILIVFIVLLFFNMNNKVKVGAPEKTNVSTDFARAYLSGPKQTEMAAEKLATLIFESNPDGPTIVNGEAGIRTLNPDGVAEQILDSQVREASSQILSVSIDKTRIKTIDSTDKDSVIDYLVKRSEIIHSAGEAINDREINFSSPEIADFELLTLVYADTVDDIYDLKVPKNLEFAHTEQIRILGIYTNIFASLAGYEEDPLQASVAISLLSKAEADLASLEQVFSNIIEEVNLITS